MYRFISLDKQINLDNEINVFDVERIFIGFNIDINKNMCIQQVNVKNLKDNYSGCVQNVPLSNLEHFGEIFYLNDLTTYKYFLNICSMHVKYLIIWAIRENFQELLELIYSNNVEHFTKCMTTEYINTAAIFGFVDILKFLIEIQCPYNEYTVSNCITNTEIFMHLIENKNHDVNFMTKILWLISNKMFIDPTIIKYLIDNGVDINNNYEILPYFIQFQDIELIKYLLEYVCIENILINLQLCEKIMIAACRSNEIFKIQLFVQLGFPINYDFDKINSLIITSIEKCYNTNVLNYLISQGINYEIRLDDYLLKAINGCNTNVIEVFLEKGINISYNNNFIFKNILRCRFYVRDMIHFAINKGVDVNCVKLCDVIEFGYSDYIIEDLIEYGIDVSQNDNEAIKLAIRTGNYCVAKLLQDHGALYNNSYLSDDELFDICNKNFHSS
ncbi:putative ankyrin repeat protein [Cotonvirus japonicus]|uniref:Ankyrin repeat protein n=1 Tax=Cotonvirus japonicus TaxID=2811091 RepID=A0ABM7NT82_9VIRU|nr:putative ankyrin repeat protein [Cotonvirus japonicus]BCS83385.1 putative ankyrin repeat protein [Cotonvirus japonicus]